MRCGNGSRDHDDVAVAKEINKEWIFLLQPPEGMKTLICSSIKPVWTFLSPELKDNKFVVFKIN